MDMRSGEFACNFKIPDTLPAVGESLISVSDPETIVENGNRVKSCLCKRFTRLFEIMNASKFLSKATWGGLTFKLRACNLIAPGEKLEQASVFSTNV